VANAPENKVFTVTNTRLLIRTGKHARKQHPMSLPSFKDPSLTRLMILAVNLGAKTLKTYPWGSEIPGKATQQWLESCRTPGKWCGFGHDMSG